MAGVFGIAPRLETGATNLNGTRSNTAIRTLDTDLKRYQQLEQILNGLPDPVPNSSECENFIPDMANGTIRLT